MRSCVLIPVDESCQLLVYAVHYSESVVDHKVTRYKWELRVSVCPLEIAVDSDKSEEPIVFNSKSKLSSRCLKSILQHSKIVKRELLCRFIPSLQKHNAHVPYKLETIEVSDSSLKLQDGNFSQELTFHKLSDEPEWDIIRTCNGETSTYYLPEVGEDDCYENQKKYTKEGLMKQLINTYLMNGTRADTIRVIGFRPSDMVYLRMRAGTIIGDFTCSNEYYSWWPFFATCGFKVFQFQMRFATKSWAKIFNNELTRSCQKVIFNYNEENKEHFPIENVFHIDADFPFYEVTCDFSYKPNKLEEMIWNWLQNNRALGASFSMLVDRYKGISEIFDKMESLLNGVRSVFPGVSGYLKHCICIPMADEKEIVVFAEQSTIPRFSWKLKIVVMEAGSTEPKRPESVLDFSGIEPEEVQEEAPLGRLCSVKVMITFFLIILIFVTLTFYYWYTNKH